MIAFMKIYQVDAFTNKRFAGNPAAVCILKEAADETWMQQLANEMNLSETAFLYKEGGLYKLRWFTPVEEVDLCGHATLASAHILWERGYEPENAPIQFDTKSGLLGAEKDGEWIEMDFPAQPPKEIPMPQTMFQALGIERGILYMGQNVSDYIVELDSEEVVRNMRPDFSLIARFPCRGLIVTSKSDEEGIDFVSRFFAPLFGINEDPVTGSAHSCLTPYWAKRLNKNDFFARQLSTRGGFLRLKLRTNRVKIGGQAITTMIGKLV